MAAEPQKHTGQLDAARELPLQLRHSTSAMYKDQSRFSSGVRVAEAMPHDGVVSRRVVREVGGVGDEQSVLLKAGTDQGRLDRTK